MIGLWLDSSRYQPGGGGGPGEPGDGGESSGRLIAILIMAVVTAAWLAFAALV